MVTLKSSVVASKDQVSSRVGDEVVLLRLSTGVYYGLNAVGATIWAALQERKSLAEIQDRVIAEYEVSAEQCEKDLLGVLKHLEEEGLIEVVE